jgi:hypothetical protein
MNLDQDLRSTLATALERCSVPDPDLARLLERGETGRRRHARRRRLTAAIAIATAAACAVGLTLVTDHRKPNQDPIHRPESPVTVQDLPVGAAPSIPYCSRGKQILGAGRPITSGCMTLVHRGSGTVGVTKHGVFWVGHGQRGLLDRRIPDLWFPVLSQDGRDAAWVVAHGSQRSLLVYDVGSHVKLADVPLPTSAAWVPGIDNLHRVYVQDFMEHGRVWMYDTASDRLIGIRDLPPVVPGASYAVNYATADGLAIAKRSFWENGITSVSIEGTVTSDGHFVASGTVPVGWSIWSPDRSQLVQETAKGFWAQRTGQLDTMVPLRVPKVGRATSTPVWESKDSLLVSFDPSLSSPGPTTTDTTLLHVPSDDLWILRCSAQTGSCEVALPPGNAGTTLRGSMLW